MSIEAMKQARELVQRFLDCDSISSSDYLDVRDAIDKAIAELESQEPVGVIGMDVSRPHLRYDGIYFGQKPDTKTAILFKDLAVGTKLYTHPPQRTWVGLTDEEIDGLVKNTRWHELIKATESKLKQKNGFAEDKNT